MRTNDEATDVLAALGLLDVPAFEPRVRAARITATGADVATARLINSDETDGGEALIAVTEWASRKRWEVGDRFFALQLDAGPRPMLSTTRNELVECLFADASPEVRSGAVRVMDVARVPGVRTKVAVAVTEGAGVADDFDAIAACVGKAANRVRYVQDALGGEQVDIVAWHPDQDQYLAAALAPASVTRVEIHESQAKAYAPSHQMSAAVGAGGLNSQLAGQLTGLLVTIVADDN